MTLQAKHCNTLQHTATHCNTLRQACNTHGADGNGHRPLQRKVLWGKMFWIVGSIKLQVSFAKEPYKRDDILQKRPKI